MSSIRAALNMCTTEVERATVLREICLDASLSDDDLAALATVYINHGPSPWVQSKWAHSEEFGKHNHHLSRAGHYMRVRRLLANQPARALLAVLRQPEVKWRALPSSHRQRSLERLLTRQLPEMAQIALAGEAPRDPDTGPEPNLHRLTKDWAFFVVHDAIRAMETMLEQGSWST